jgi:hypothetical protein
MDMQPIEPNRPPPVQLTAEQWNVVLGHLDAGQHRVVRRIIDSLVAQLQRRSQPPPISSALGQQGMLPPVQGMPEDADNA